MGGPPVYYSASGFAGGAQVGAPVVRAGAAVNQDVHDCRQAGGPGLAQGVRQVAGVGNLDAENSRSRGLRRRCRFRRIRRRCTGREPGGGATIPKAPSLNTTQIMGSPYCNRGGEGVDGHHIAAVAGDASHGPAGVGDLQANGGRQPPAHSRRATGTEKRCAPAAPGIGAPSRFGCCRRPGRTRYRRAYIPAICGRHAGAKPEPSRCRSRHPHRNSAHACDQAERRPIRSGRRQWMQRRRRRRRPAG